jgi:hypothetical protein
MTTRLRKNAFDSSQKKEGGSLAGTRRSRPNSGTKNIVTGQTGRTCRWRNRFSC